MYHETKECPICGRLNISRSFIDLDRETDGYYICHRCGFYYQEEASDCKRNGICFSKNEIRPVRQFITLLRNRKKLSDFEELCPLELYDNVF